MAARKGQKQGVVTTYSSAHERVKRLRGFPSQHVCQCGTKAYDWAYLGNDPNELTDSQTGCKFSLDALFYVPMCRSCHRRMDFWARITQCPQQHEYTPENTYWEKNGRARICRRCKLDRNEARRQRKLKGIEAAA